jgi:hypothetical protein
LPVPLPGPVVDDVDPFGEPLGLIPVFVPDGFRELFELVFPVALPVVPWFDMPLVPAEPSIELPLPLDIEPLDIEPDVEPPLALPAEPLPAAPPPAPPPPAASASVGPSARTEANAIVVSFMVVSFLT